MIHEERIHCSGSMPAGISSTETCDASPSAPRKPPGSSQNPTLNRVTDRVTEFTCPESSSHNTSVAVFVSSTMIANPYPVYCWIRHFHPVFHDADTRSWYIARYHDIAGLLRSPSVSSNRVGALVSLLPEEERSRGQTLVDALSRWLLFRDPPEHTPFRKALMQTLTNRLVIDMEPRIAALVNELIDQFRDQGHADIIRDLAYPLPAIVIAELLGAPASDREYFKRWSDDLADFLGTPPTTETVERAGRSAQEMSDYFYSLLSRQRRQGISSLMSALYSVIDSDERFDDDDLVANCLMLVFAGHETTTNLIGNGLLALLEHPDELAALRSNPALIDSAIDECLRFDSPVQRLTRVTTASIEINGWHVSKGQRLVFLLGAANRDPAVFQMPERFDIRRQSKRHLALGHGIHFCPGAALGRMEARCAIRGLLDRLPSLMPAFDSGTPPWRRNFQLRGLRELPVQFDA